MLTWKNIVSFPHTAVLFLRSRETTPNKMGIVIRTPGGEVSYQVPVMIVREYTIEEIFEKDLLFLVPFYIFTYEPHFQEIDASFDRLADLTAEYEGIVVELERRASTGAIDEFTKRTIMDMSERVLANIAKSYENIRKGLGTVMGGKILDYEAKRIRNEGIIIGTIETLRDIGMDDRTIITKIMEKYALTKKEAESYVLSYAVM